jgi:uncharacterized protein YbjT (DUF2867 family)
VLLLCGATGELGGRVARHLAGRGADLRLLVRPESAAPDALEAEVVPGDLRDPASLARAVRGASTVVATATAMGRALAGAPLDVRAVDGHGMLALVDAAERAGVERFVYVSYAGVSDEAARAHPLGAAKRAVERRLARADMRAVIVRPDMFQEVWLGPLTRFDWPAGRVIVLGRGESRARYVAVDDVAEAVARLALAADPPAAVELGGPDALTRREAVALFERVAGRPFTTHHIPRAALRAGMRVLRRARPHVASVMGHAYFADLHEASWSDAPLRSLGVEPRGVEAYAEAVLRAVAE